MRALPGTEDRAGLRDPRWSRRPNPRWPIVAFAGRHHATSRVCRNPERQGRKSAQDGRTPPAGSGPDGGSRDSPDTGSRTGRGRWRGARGTSLLVGAWRSARSSLRRRRSQGSVVTTSGPSRAVRDSAIAVWHGLWSAGTRRTGRAGHRRPSRGAFPSMRPVGRERTGDPAGSSTTSKLPSSQGRRTGLSCLPLDPKTPPRPISGAATSSMSALRSTATT